MSLSPSNLKVLGCGEKVLKRTICSAPALCACSTSACSALLASLPSTDSHLSALWLTSPARLLSGRGEAVISFFSPAVRVLHKLCLQGSSAQCLCSCRTKNPTSLSAFFNNNLFFKVNSWHKESYLLFMVPCRQQKVFVCCFALCASGITLSFYFSAQSGASFYFFFINTCRGDHSSLPCSNQYQTDVFLLTFEGTDHKSS